jgi:hypothetical protein
MKKNPPIDLPTEYTIFAMTIDELAKVPFDKLKWGCAIKHCKHYSTVKDYGTLPNVYWRKKWINLNFNILLCAKHWKRYNKGKTLPQHYKKEGSGIDHLIK